jgi:putative protease
MFNGVPQTALKLIPSLTDLGVATFRVEVLFDSAEVTRRKVEIYSKLLAGNTGSAEVVRELGAVERYGVTDGQLYAIRGYTDRKKDFVPLDKLANSADPGLKLITRKGPSL